MRKPLAQEAWSTNKGDNHVKIDQHLCYTDTVRCCLSLNSVVRRDDLIERYDFLIVRCNSSFVLMDIEITNLPFRADCYIP